MLRIPVLGFVLAASVAVPSAAMAHHSPFALYDGSRQVSLEGTVTDVAWRNPHVYLTIAMPGEDGTTTTQVIETAAISDLHANGWTQETLAVGERVSVLAFPSRRGPGNRVFGLSLTKADGVSLPLQPGLDAAAPDAAAESIAGTWLADAETFFGILNDSSNWSPTEAALAAAEDPDGLRAAEADCDPVGLPLAMTAPVVSVFEVGADAVWITIDLDAEHTRRVIHLDGRPRPPNAPRTREGYSRGRWVGDTLEVDTDWFAADPEGLFVAVPSGEDKRLVERFRLGDDRRHLQYEVTVEDPEFLREPVSFATRFRYRPDLRLARAACDPATARRFLVEE